MDFKDFVILSNHFGRDGQLWAAGDFNGDRLVNYDGLSILRQSFPEAPTEPLPEPATLLLPASGAALPCRRRRRI